MKNIYVHTHWERENINMRRQMEKYHLLLSIVVEHFWMLQIWYLKRYATNQQYCVWRI